MAVEPTEGGSTVLDSPQEQPTVFDKPVPVANPATFAQPSLTGDAELTSLTTAADAMRDEEVERTRMFIRMGWGISVASIGMVPMLPAPRAVQIAMVAAMVVGMVVSFVYHQRFADPRKYNAAALLRISLMCVINAHVAILYFGAYTIAPVIVVVGIHFVARTEAVRTAQVAFATGAPLLVPTKLVGALPSWSRISPMPRVARCPRRSSSAPGRSCASRAGPNPSPRRCRRSEAVVRPHHGRAEGVQDPHQSQGCVCRRVASEPPLPLLRQGR